MTAPRPARRRARLLGLWLGAVSCAALPGVSGAERPRPLHRQAEEAYAAGRFEEAAGLFEETGRAFARAGADPAPARLNQGLALARAGRIPDAVQALTAALASPDLDTQTRAQYALGTLLGRQADAAAGQDDAAAVRDFEQALRRLESALRLAPDHEDAKINYELAQARLQAARKRIEEQKKQEQEKKPEEPEKPEPDPSKPEEQKKPEPGEQKPQESSDSQKPEKPEPGEQKPEPEAGDEDRKPGGEPQTAPQEPAGDTGRKEGPAESGERNPDEQMTPEEARMILDALRQDEDAKRRQIRVRHGEPEPVEKDW